MLSKGHNFRLDAIVSNGHMMSSGLDGGANMTSRKPMQLRLPIDLKDWIAAQAKLNAASQNSEIIRAIRERMITHENKSND